jgi:hypothetical protein
MLEEKKHNGGESFPVKFTQYRKRFSPVKVLPNEV